MSGIAEKFIFVEVHSKDQSRMNQAYSYHDIFHVKDGSFERYFLEPIFERKINTYNHICYEERFYVEKTKCLNNYYMSKLNCTFPWLKPTEHSEEKFRCGSKDFIKDLVDLVGYVSTGK